MKSTYRKYLLERIEIDIEESKLSSFDWFDIACNHNLSEGFIREFKDKLDWEFVSEYQFLSEDFIREFQNKLDWYHLSKKQKLSDSFLLEFQNKIVWDLYLTLHQVEFTIMKRAILRSSFYIIDKLVIEHLTNHQRLEIQILLSFKYQFVNKT